MPAPLTLQHFKQDLALQRPATLAWVSFWLYPVDDYFSAQKAAAWMNTSFLLFPSSFLLQIECQFIWEDEFDNFHDGVWVDIT